MRSQLETRLEVVRRLTSGADMSYRQIACAVVAFACLAGCGAFADPEVVSGDADQVTISAGTHMNPAVLAEAHCKEHDKSPILTDIEEPDIYGLESIFYFDCR